MKNKNSDKKKSNNDSHKESEKVITPATKLILIILVLAGLYVCLIKSGAVKMISDDVAVAVMFNTSEIGIKKGDIYNLNANIIPDSVKNNNVVYTSSNTDIAIINNSNIIALNEGKVVITAKTNNKKESKLVVNVSENDIFPISLDVLSKNIMMGVGYSQNILYEINPKDANLVNLRFVSSDSSVATVDSKGMVTGVKDGNTLIYIIVNNNQFISKVNVTVFNKNSGTIVNGKNVFIEKYPKSLKMSTDDLNLAPKTSSQLVATSNLKNDNNLITWFSTNPLVATVDSNGLVKAIKNGTTQIVAKTLNNIYAICNVTVGDYSIKLKNISLSNISEIKVGEDKQLIVSYNPNNASNRSLVWSSSDTEVLKVNENGKITGISAGSSIVSVRSVDGDYKVEKEIKVLQTNNISPTNISFSNKNYSLKVGETESLNLTVEPFNSSFDILFISSNSDVVDVSKNGVIKGVSPGNATITAKVMDMEANVEVVVGNQASSAIYLNKSVVNLKQNESFLLVGSVIPSNASNKTVSFKSENPSIASVSENGLIKGINPGTTIITVTPNGGGESSTCIVNVK